MNQKRRPPRLFIAVLILALSSIGAARANEKGRLACSADFPGSSSPYWIAKEAGLFETYGFASDLIFSSTGGAQRLIAGILDFAGAVGSSPINGKDQKLIPVKDLPQFTQVLKGR
jgi:ABC-type nitrate/sulfonate/bicarbonate transport system substrate-binding protein